MLLVLAAEVALGARKPLISDRFLSACFLLLQLVLALVAALNGGGLALCCATPIGYASWRWERRRV